MNSFLKSLGARVGSPHKKIRKIVRGALSGSGATSAGPYTIYREEGQSEVVTLVFDSESAGHKYITAVAESGPVHFVAMPLTFIKLHREILRHLKHALGEEVVCTGGGYLEFEEDSVEAYGESQDFGEGDHRKAGELFTNVSQSL